MNTGLALLLAVVAASGGSVVRGVVSGPDGMPVSQADVVIIVGGYGPAVTHPVRTDGEGVFEIELAAEEPQGIRTIIAYCEGAGVGFSTFYPSQHPKRPVALKLVPAAPRRVQLLDPQGRPAARTKVTLSSFVVPPENRHVGVDVAESELLSPVTDAQGVVTFKCLPAESETCFLLVQSPDYGQQSVRVQIQRTGDPLHRVALAPAGRVTGRLVAEDLTGVAGTLVVLFSAPTGNPPPPLSGVARVRVDPEGRFEVPAIVAGDVLVAAVVPAKGFRSFAGEQQKFSLAANQVGQIEIPMRRGVRVFGRVVEMNTTEPVPGVAVRIAAQQQQEGTNTVGVSDKDGKFEVFLRQGAGPYVTPIIKQLPAPYVQASGIPRNPVLPKDAIEYELPLIRVQRGVYVSGTVAEKDGHPVPFARVRALLSISLFDEADQQSRKTTGRADAEADAQGRFTLGPVAADAEMLLCAEDDTRGSIEALRFDVKDADGRDKLRLVIEPPGLVSISGRIIDDDGAPLAGAAFTVTAEELSPDPKLPMTNYLSFGEKQQIETDHSGRFQLPWPLSRLPKYTIRMQNSSNGPTQHELVNVSVPVPDRDATAVTVPDIVLRKLQRFEGRVVDRQNQPIAGALVSSHGPTWNGPHREAKTDGQGSFRLDGIHSRARLVFVRQAGYRFGGGVIPRGADPLTMTLTRLDEPAPAGQNRTTRTLPKERRRELLDALFGPMFANEAAARNLRVQIEAIKRSEFSDPQQLAERLQPIRPRAVLNEVWLAHGRYADAVANTEAIDDPASRFGLEVNLADTTADRAEKRQRLDAALAAARKTVPPWRAVHNQSTLVRKLTRLGDREAAKELLKDSLQRLSELDPKTNETASVRLSLAVSSAPLDPEQSLRLLGTPPASGALDTTFAGIARALAATQPEAAEQALTEMVQPFQREYTSPPVCFSMAPVDLPRAKRIATSIATPDKRGLALGAIAQSIGAKEPQQARQLLRQAFDQLDQGLRGQSGGREFEAAVGLVRVAETVEPDAVEEFVWHAAALYPGPAGGGAPEQRPERQFSQSGLLVALLGLYGVEPLATRDLALPLVQRLSDIDRFVPKPNEYKSDHELLCLALAVVYPEKAVDWHREYQGRVPADRWKRTTSTEPWAIIVHAIDDEPKALWEFLQTHLLHQWVIGAEE